MNEQRPKPSLVIGLVGVGAFFGALTTLGFTSKLGGAPWLGLLFLVVFTFVTLWAAFES